MTVPYVLGFYGRSDSGKTTLITKLVKKLHQKNYTVAVVKQSDKHHSLDSQGKDTWKHTHAGAAVVVFSSPLETAYLNSSQQSTSEILQHLSFFHPFDVVLIEGVHDPTIPKIRIGDIEERDNTIISYDNDEEKILMVILDNIKKANVHSTISLKVNGKPIPLTEFPAAMIQSTIVGMVQSLKGVEDIETIDLHIKK